MLTDNSHEREVFTKDPYLKSKVFNIENGQTFQVQDDIQIESIYTPGHLDDHMSFLIKTPQESILISGDIVLGTPSSVVDDLDVYLKTLKMLHQINIDFLLLPHSTGMDVSDIIVPAHEKLSAYI